MPKNINITKPAYTMATSDGSKAEITMYGDIYEQRPTTWDGKPVEGQFILLSEFLSDLEQVANCKDITIRMNSYGGDAGVSNTIHNRLRELSRDGAKLTCIVDGVAMSGGSLIMCACDTVKVNPSSLIMIHKCWTFLFGGYNADELRDQAKQQDAWDQMQIEVYKRKTGLSDTVISHMMSETTYMTGPVAVEKGFADEVLEDAEPVNIAASADGRILFVNGRQMHLTPGMFAPDNIPTVTPEASAPVATNNEPEEPGKGGTTMAKNLEELRAENPELAAQLETEARAAVENAGAHDPTPSAADAAAAERQRIREIDEIAGQFDAATVEAAKYGDHPCTAAEMAYNAAKNAAKQGAKFLAALDADSDESGAQDVEGTGGGNEADGEQDSPEAMAAQAQADVKAFINMKEGK